LLLNGLGFSCLSIWLSPDAASVYHYFPAMILIGISAGAVATLSFRMKNIIAYFILFLVPLFITEVLIGTFVSYSVATLTVLLAVFSLANAKRFNQTAIENIALHYNIEEQHQKLIESRNAAIEANSTKTNFISMVSHELRTPLNAMLGYSQLLRMSDSPGLNEEQNEQTQGIIDSGKHLLSLIEELLDLSRIESHKLKVEVEDISLVDVLNESIRLLNPVASQYHIEIENKVENVYLVKADSKRLKQIFINLISNAIKYNHEHGKVKIDVDEVSGSQIRVLITDTGNGLSEEQIQGLFQPFKRYDHKIEGIGLGLYITQNLVELMGGKIGVESEPEKGSVFWFSLKLIEKM
jgi:signal transduction histidine kinase